MIIFARLKLPTHLQPWPRNLKGVFPAGAVIIMALIASRSPSKMVDSVDGGMAAEKRQGSSEIDGLSTNRCVGLSRRSRASGGSPRLSQEEERANMVPRSKREWIF